MKINVTVVIQKDDDWYVAKCVENNIASQGKSIDEAINNLKEALQLYYDDDTIPYETHQTFVTTMEVAI
jgi:predicted RNase H-like HicB family nuclease